MPRRANTACSATMIAATLPWPPNSPTNRPPGAQRARDAGDHRVGVGAHPMQGGVGEHGIELAGERQGGAVDQACVDAALPGLPHHVGGRVHSDDRAAELGQPQGQHTVAAAEVEDALARLRRQQLQYWRAQIGDEPGIGRVASSVPFLTGRWNLHLYLSHVIG